MDNLFHLALYQACDYLSMIGLKFNHVSRRGPWHPFYKQKFAKQQLFCVCPKHFTFYSQEPSLPVIKLYSASRVWRGPKWTLLNCKCTFERSHNLSSSQMEFVYKHIHLLWNHDSDKLLIRAVNAQRPLQRLVICKAFSCHAILVKPNIALISSVYLMLQPARNRGFCSGV